MFKFIFTLALLAAPVSAHAAPDATGHVATGSGASIYFERYGDGPNVVLIPRPAVPARVCKPRRA